MSLTQYAEQCESTQEIAKEAASLGQELENAQRELDLRNKAAQVGRLGKEGKSWIIILVSYNITA